MGEHVTHKVGATGHWCVLGTYQDEIKSLIDRTPRTDVADVYPMCPVGQSLAGKLDELGDNIKAVWLDYEVLTRTPSVSAFHENAARATDIEKCSVPV